MRELVRLTGLVALAALITACAGAAPSGQPTASPSPIPGGAGAIEHATGATDILLRYDEGGGFVPIEFFASHVPIFTLYGDGTVIYRNPAADALPAVGGVTPNRPLRTARLSEAQIQATLLMAISEGGLGVARLDYTNVQVADASTATFTLKAGGISKTVSVYALGMEAPGGQDAQARAAFRRLADRLASFDQGGIIATADFVPGRYRGMLMDGVAGNATKPWPWADLKPSDFVAPADQTGVRLPSKVLSATQAEALGIWPYLGGFERVLLAGPSGDELYSFSLRPLLPDEDA